MNRQKWIAKFNIPENSEVIFYQNPKFYLSNSFKREFTNIEEWIIAKIKLYVITGVCNSHHKNNGKRQKICLVKEYLK